MNMGPIKNKPMEVKKEFLTGLFWASSGSGLAKIINLFTLIVLARLLNPDIFGLIAIALLITNTLGIFSDYGLGAALIQKEKITEKDNDTVLLTTPIINIFIYAIAYLLAVPAGSFFGNGDVVLIIKILSLILIIQSLGMVPLALLQKELKYKKILITDISASIVYFLVAVGFAYNGKGVWSLVFGQLARYSTQLIVVWLVSDWKPGWRFHRDSLKSLYGFGKHIVLLGIISFIVKNLDNAVIAKFLTPRDLGLYTMAYTIGNILPMFIKSTIGRIAFPVYSKWDKDKNDFKRRFLLINKFNLIFCLWITLLLITTSSFLIPLLLGGKWTASVVMIQALAFFGFQRSVGSVCAPALNAIGVPQAQREPMILNSLIFVPLIIPIVKFFGVEGAAVLATISIIPGFIWTVYRTFKLLGLKSELGSFFRPLLTGCLILVLWVILKPFISSLVLLNLFTNFFLVSIIFWVIMWICEKKLFSQIYQLREIVRSTA